MRAVVDRLQAQALERIVSDIRDNQWLSYERNGVTEHPSLIVDVGAKFSKISRVL